MNFGTATRMRCLLPVVPDIGRELPVCSDLLPHHEILAGDFLRTRSLHLRLNVPISCAEGPKGLTSRVMNFSWVPTSTGLGAV